jgi:hypothetical protein
MSNGEASLAIKESQGTIVTSSIGYSLNAKCPKKK